MASRKIAHSFVWIIALLTIAGCAGSPTATPVVARQVTPTVAGVATATSATQATAAPAATAVTGSVVATATATSAAQPAPTTMAGAGGETVAAALAQNKSVHDVSSSSVADAAKATQITLTGNAIQITGKGVTANGSKATITAAGTYSIQGSLADGQIVVDTKDKGPVKLILNGVTLSNSSGSAIYIKEAKEAVLILAANSQNQVSDGKSYAAGNAEDEPNAAIYSTADLTISGSGSLTVVGNYNDGIASQDGLVIVSGTVTVTAADDGVRGKDYLVIKNGRLTVKAAGDGLKSDNDEDAARGYILIENGALNVTSGGDALAAETDVLIAGGTVTLSSGGGYKARIAQDTSAKGIKGVVSVIIDGGTFAIDSADDALHSNGSIVVNNGSFTMATADDGMHADATLTINGGDIRITSSYEGIESAIITINNGVIHVVSSDDGVNVAAGNDGSGMNPPQGFGGGTGRGAGPGQDAFANTGSKYLYINGGRLVVDATGDGLDANGKIVMTGGVVIVNGPTAQMNGPLDHSGFKMTGGFLIAVGSSGMAQAPDTTSTQNAVLVNFSAALKAGTLIRIQSSDGKEIVTFSPTKQYQSIAFSSPALVKGVTYDVYYGGSSTGTAQDGVYQSGAYAGGAKLTSFTVSSVVTTMGGRGR